MKTAFLMVQFILNNVLFEKTPALIKRQRSPRFNLQSSSKHSRMQKNRTEPIDYELVTDDQIGVAFSAGSGFIPSNRCFLAGANTTDISDIVGTAKCLD